MTNLPPEDQPDAIDIGPIRGIPIIHDDDPRFEEERRARSRATAKAQAMHSSDDLLRGMSDEDWMVRHEVVDRLIARAGADPRTLPVLLAAAVSDEAWQVRDAVVLGLGRFPRDGVRETLHRARNDEHPDVRWSASFALNQLGERD